MKKTFIVFIVGLFLTIPINQSSSDDKMISIPQKDVEKAVAVLQSEGIRSTLIESAILPKIEIVGANEPVPFGEMVHLKAIVDPSSLPKDVTEVKYKWMVLDGASKKTAVVWPDGTQIFFGAGVQEKSFVVILNVECLFEQRSSYRIVDKDENQIQGAKLLYENGNKINDVVTRATIQSPEPIMTTVKIVNPNPIPIPPPGPIVPVPPTPTPTPDPVVPPKPNPTPTFPIGSFNFSKLAYEQAIANVDQEGKAKAKSMAEGYAKIADQIRQSMSKLAAGVPLNAEDIQLNPLAISAAMKAENISNLGNTRDKWVTWNTAMDQHYQMLAGKGEFVLANYDHWATTFEEIAAGLKEVK